MSVQTSYGYRGPIGSAGGIVDLAPYAIDTFLNQEDNGVMKFGVGVVQGETPGTNIALPTSDSTVAQFEGITTNNRTTEYDMEGKILVYNGSAVGVMRYGRIYARVAEGANPAYGDQVYVITDGDEAGYVTNAEGGLEIKARFMGGVDNTTQIAPVELFNQAQESAASGSDTGSTNP